MQELETQFQTRGGWTKQSTHTQTRRQTGTVSTHAIPGFPRIPFLFDIFSARLLLQLIWFFRFNHGLGTGFLVRSGQVRSGKASFPPGSIGRSVGRPFGVPADGGVSQWERYGQILSALTGTYGIYGNHTASHHHSVVTYYFFACMIWYLFLARECIGWGGGEKVFIGRPAFRIRIRNYTVASTHSVLSCYSPASSNSSIRLQQVTDL